MTKTIFGVLLCALSALPSRTGMYSSLNLKPVTRSNAHVHYQH